MKLFYLFLSVSGVILLLMGLGIVEHSVAVPDALLGGCIAIAGLLSFGLFAYLSVLFEVSEVRDINL